MKFNRACTHSDARQQLIEEHISLVKQIVNRLGYLKTGEIEEEDLVSYGIIGLIEAADKFEADKGYSFKTFATHRIRGAIYDQFRSIDKASRTSRKKIKHFQACVQQLEQELKASPSNKQIADKMKISLKELQQIQYEATFITLSLDSLVSEDSDESWIEQISDNKLSPDESCEEKNFYENLVKCIETLPEREKTVIGLYHYRKLTMKEIAQVLKVSESRACQIHNRGIALLRVKLTTIFKNNVS